MKKIILLAMVLFFCSCVVITIKENHLHIHDNTGDVNAESEIKGSDLDDTLNGSGNPELDIPLTP